MKNLSISLFAALMLFFCASTVQAQNKSAENSDVIDIHGVFEFTRFIDCPETGPIIFEGTVHKLLKILPSGTFTWHYNAYGEGTDQDGRLVDMALLLGG